jgi:hypothetical protein
VQPALENAVKPQTVRVILLAGLLNANGVASAQPRLGVKRSEELKITIRVHNYVELSPALLMRAEEVATRLLLDARLTPVWLDCRPMAENTVRDSGCNVPLQKAALVLRVLPRPATSRMTSDENAFGEALVPDGGGSGTYADVYPEGVNEIAERAGVSNTEILGRVIAHEIGHLLLGTNSHSSSGLMRARWSPKDLAPTAQNTFCFTPRQAESVRAAVRDRVRQSEASQLAMATPSQ